MKNFLETDVRVEEERGRIEDAIESEDQKKLQALLKPGALPTMSIYVKDELEVWSITRPHNTA